MRKLSTFIAAAIAIIVASCNSYDDSLVWDKLSEHDSRLVALEELCKEANSNIDALSTLVGAMKESDSIVSVTPITENGKTVGYTITFTKSAPITIYNGKDGSDGKDGEDGEDGKDGINGDGSYIPMIGIKKDVDNHYYWTLDGDWILDANGNKVSAEGAEGSQGVPGDTGAAGTPGKDGVTPQLRIEGGFWQVSYDNGATWKELGRATVDGGGGSSIFADVYEKDGYIHFVLTDGDSFKLPTSVATSFEITFNVEQGVAVVPGTTIKVEYTITGAKGRTFVRAMCYEDDPVLVSPIDDTHGYIYYVMPDFFDGEDEAYRDKLIDEEYFGDATYEDYYNGFLYVLVMVSDSTGNQVTKALNFSEGVLKSVEDAYVTDAVAGSVNVTINTNIAAGTFEIVIPDKAKSWISYNPTTRAEMREDVLTFDVAANTSDKFRSANIALVNELGQRGESFVIVQRSSNAGEAVVFEDPRVEALCVARYDANLDGKLTYEEIATVTDVKDLFLLDKKIVSFNEFEYFTSVTYLPYEMFAECTLLESIKLPESITYIGSYAFRNCQSLKSIVIPEGVKCSPDSDYYDEYGYSWFEGCSSLESVILPSTLEELPNHCFENCVSLTTITIPEGIDEIPYGCFSGCEQLSTINITTPIKKIGSSAFRECSMLTSFDLSHLSNSYDEDYYEEYSCLGESAFAYSGLTSVTIPESVTRIYDYVFEGCVDLASVTLHDNITYIGGSAFSGCSDLKNTELPLNLEQIGYRAFQNSGLEGEVIDGTSMKALVIPAKVKSIGDYAFTGCSNLSAVKMLSMYPPKQDGSFNTTTAIYVHPDVVRDYKESNYWYGYTILPYEMMLVNLQLDFEVAEDVAYDDNYFHFPVSASVSGDITAADNVEEFGYYVKTGDDDYYYDSYVTYYPVENLGATVTDKVSVYASNMSKNYDQYRAYTNGQVGAYIRLVDGTIITYDNRQVEFVYDEPLSLEFVGYEYTDMEVYSDCTYLYFSAEYKVTGGYWLYNWEVCSDNYVGYNDISYTDTNTLIINGYWKYYNSEENPTAEVSIEYRDRNYNYYTTDPFTLTTELPDVEVDVAMGSCTDMYGVDCEANLPTGYWAAIRIIGDGDQLESISYLYAYTEYIDASGLSDEELVDNYGEDDENAIGNLKQDGVYFLKSNVESGSNITMILRVTSVFGKTKYYRVDYTVPNVTGLDLGYYQISEYNEELGDTTSLRIRLLGGKEEGKVKMVLEPYLDYTYNGVIDRENRTITFNGVLDYWEDTFTFNSYFWWYNEATNEVCGFWSSSDAEHENSANLVFSYDENGVITSLNNYFEKRIANRDTMEDYTAEFSFTPNATIEKEGMAQPQAKAKARGYKPMQSPKVFLGR